LRINLNFAKDITNYKVSNNQINSFINYLHFKVNRTTSGIVFRLHNTFMVFFTIRNIPAAGYLTIEMSFPNIKTTAISDLNSANHLFTGFTIKIILTYNVRVSSEYQSR